MPKQCNRCDCDSVGNNSLWCLHCTWIFRCSIIFINEITSVREFPSKKGEILHYWASILRQSMSKHILSSCTTFLLCSMLHLTPFEVSTKVYVRRRSSWRRKSCENIITWSIWIEIKTHMRALHLHALTKRELNRLSTFSFVAILFMWYFKWLGQMNPKLQW